jgi:hypothetical protein
VATFLANFGELRACEVRRIPLLRRWVNKPVGRHLVFLPENVVILADCG